MKKIIQYFKETSFGIFIVFTLMLFLKCILFHYFCYGYVAVSSLWTSPVDFFAFYVSKLFPAVLIASFVFLAKKQWWTILVSLLVDVWMVSNYVYFRSYGLFLNIDVIGMAGNLSGFWNSIIAYINWKTLMFLVITILYTIYVIVCKPKERKVIPFFICFVVALLLYGCDLLLYTGKVFYTPESRIVQVKKMAEGKSSASMTHYVESSSILHYLPVMAIYQHFRSEYLESYTGNVEYSEEEKNKIETLFKDIEPKDTVQTNLIVILVESLESWALQFKDDNDEFVAPCLKDFIDTSGSLLYCPKIKSQALYGNSGDGQMLVNTGMLPIQTGAACMLFGKNTFPNFGHYYSDAICVNAANNNVWNQYEMNACYDYNDYIFPEYKGANDADIFDMAYKRFCSKKGFRCVQIITISTHVPFVSVGNVDLPFKEDMPQNMRGYLNCLHYTDSCIGNFLNRFDSDSLLSNSTIVITGDHTVFKKSLLDEFVPFAQKYNYSIPRDESYCPLIVYSPRISGNVIIENLCYQMDVFPTIMHCIGIDDYYWNGFGVCVLDSVALSNRFISETDAYMLSDKMIRDNYFNKRKND